MPRGKGRVDGGVRGQGGWNSRTHRFAVFLAESKWEERVESCRLRTVSIVLFVVGQHLQQFGQAVRQRV